LYQLLLHQLLLELQRRRRQLAPALPARQPLLQRLAPLRTR